MKKQFFAKENQTNKQKLLIYISQSITNNSPVYDAAAKFAAEYGRMKFWCVISTFLWNIDLLSVCLLVFFSRPTYRALSQASDEGKVSRVTFLFTLSFLML